MRFKCGPTHQEKYRIRHEYLENWHLWFAWYPVRIADNDCRWLEHILVKGTFQSCGPESWWTWEVMARDEQDYIS